MKMDDKNFVHISRRLLEWLIDSDLPEDQKNKIRRWFSEEVNQQYKDKAYKELFFGSIEEGEPDEWAHDSFEKLKRIIDKNNKSGSFNSFSKQFDEEKGIKRNRRIGYETLFKIAAVIIPLLVLTGTFLFTFNKTPGDNISDTNTSNVKETKIEYVTVIASQDSIQLVDLPDGSRIKLIAGTLEYPQDFEANRNVKLEGEAYFSVAKMNGMPFIVKTDNMSVTVLGTEFKVRSSKEKELNEVALVSGEVKVMAGEKSITLKPNQRITLDKKLNTMELHEIEEAELLRIRGLSLSLNGHTLDEAFRMIGQYFGVKMKISNKVNLDLKVVANYHDDIKLEEALHLLQLTNKAFEYEIEGDMVTIKMAR